MSGGCCRRSSSLTLSGLGGALRAKDGAGTAKGGSAQIRTVPVGLHHVGNLLQRTTRSLLERDLDWRLGWLVLLKGRARK